jgi:4-hydroxy-2-oxoheptanedioate aldolase
VNRNEIRARWREGSPAFGAWCITGSPYLAELLAIDGYHYVCLDVQHGLMGYETFLSCVQAIARSNATPVVRVPANDSAWIGKVLDAGAETVVVPMIESAEEAKRAVAACRYFPLGHRSIGSTRGSNGLGTDIHRVNEEVACIVMIETARGVERADEICAVEGVDGVYIGPGDLAITMGLAPRIEHYEGAHSDAIEAVRSACDRYGIVAGIQCASGKMAKQMADRGFKMITVATDAHLMRAAAKHELGEAGVGVDHSQAALYG